MAAAVGIAGFNAYQKYAVDRNSPLVVSFQAQLFTLPFTGIVALLAPDPTPSIMTLVVVGASGMVNAASYYLLAEALRMDDLSVISPLRSIVPVSVALVEPLVLTAEYSVPVLVASLLAAVGTYVLLIEDSLTTPLKRINSRGVQLGVISALIITAAVLLDRFGVTQTSISPTAYAFYLPLATAIALAVFALLASEDVKEVLRPSLKLAPIGFFRSINLVAAMAAFALTTGTNVTILMRVGILISILVGGSLFDEEYLLYRISGGLMLITGAAMIALFG